MKTKDIYIFENPLAIHPFTHLTNLPNARANHLLQQVKIIQTPVLVACLAERCLYIYRVRLSTGSNYRLVRILHYAQLLLLPDPSF